ncbi:MAG TPA: beta-L-arabinofuranosidase domain-containing protein, partial [Fimbriimonadaceae bacterium]|nr:beta-L-arabinofuranosidase domain-containing protein [Fimbriimonadaceae bacterium]
MPFRRRMRRIPLTDIQLNDDFWSARQKALRETTIEAEYQQLAETGRLRNFQIAAGKAEGDFTGLYFNDSDVYKWCEAATYALATGRNK